MTDLTPEQWASTVEAVLAAHPDWTAVTVRALQSGLMEALDHQQERISSLSLGLVEAINTRPGAKRRVPDRIVKAVRASNYHPTEWSADVIAKEESQ